MKVFWLNLSVFTGHDFRLTGFSVNHTFDSLFDIPVLEKSLAWWLAAEDTHLKLLGEYRMPEGLL